MENLKIKDLMDGLYTGDFGDRFCDYNNGYICDIITEIADNNIDIYYSDLFDWAKGNTTYIDEATAEFGRPDTFIQEIQQGQYYAYEQDLYENLEDSLKLFMYNYILYTLDIEEITEEQDDELLDYDFSDNNDQLENIIEHINEVLKIEE